MIENFKNEVNLILFLLLYIGPYCLLFYKKVNLRIRLLFVSMIEILVLCIMMSFYFFGSEIAVETGFFYEQFVVISIFLNSIMIFLSWLFEKMKQHDNNLKT
jgi:hypothetical protein